MLKELKTFSTNQQKNVHTELRNVKQSRQDSWNTDIKETTLSVRAEKRQHYE